MRPFDTIGHRLCQEQAELFEASLNNSDLGSELFIRRFVYSNLARRFDDLSLINEIFEVDEALNSINGDTPTKRIGKRYSRETMYWIGYIYRYWCYTYEQESLEVYKIVRPSELAKLYYIYHTLDTSKAIERIREAKGLDQEDQIAKGVALYREILKRKA